MKVKEALTNLTLALFVAAPICVILGIWHDWRWFPTAGVMLLLAVWSYSALPKD